MRIAVGSLILLAMAAESRRPVPAAALAAPSLTRVELPGGLRGLVVTEASRRTTTLLLQLPDAVLDEPVGQEGGLALAAHALACQLERPGGPLHEVGGWVEASVRLEAIDLAIEVPGADLGPAGLALAELQRVQALDPACVAQARLALARADAAVVDRAARGHLRATLYPKQRRAQGVHGSVATRDRLQPAQLKALWQSALRGHHPLLAVLGPASSEQVAAALAPRMASVAAAVERAARPAAPPALGPPRIELLDAPASEPLLLLLGLRVDAPATTSEAARALLRDAWLQVGAPRSLADHGCQGLDDEGDPVLPGRAQVLVLRCPELAVDALRPLLDQAAADLDRLRRAPLPAKILRALQERRSGQLLLALEQPAAQARALCALEREGGRAEVLPVLPRTLDSVTPRSLQEAAVALLAPGALRALVRGPAASLSPQLADLQP